MRDLIKKGNILNANHIQLWNIGLINLLFLQDYMNRWQKQNVDIIYAGIGNKFGTAWPLYKLEWC